MIYTFVSMDTPSFSVCAKNEKTALDIQLVKPLPPSSLSPQPLLLSPSPLLLLDFCEAWPSQSAPGAPHVCWLTPGKLPRAKKKQLLIQWAVLSRFQELHLSFATLEPLQQQVAGCFQCFRKRALRLRKAMVLFKGS